MGRIARPPSERFWEKVVMDGPLPSHAPELGPCWLWNAQLDRDGYGVFTLRHHVPVRAYRFAYELLIGTIPSGLQIDHLCRVRGCVNPLHLEPVTCQVNVLRSDGLAAQNAKVTHCPQGHPYDNANTILKADRRVCRTCNREGCRRYYQKRKVPA